jgi:hypothetical protein
VRQDVLVGVADVPAGATASFNFTIHAPSSGTFPTAHQWQMFASGVGFFGQSIDVPVTISPAMGTATGCADGTREGFTDAMMFPNIAACSGGWSVPGVMNAGLVAPACNRVSGNSSANPSGTGCNVADLCAAGWHVCNTDQDVLAHVPSIPGGFICGTYACTSAVPGTHCFFTSGQGGAPPVPPNQPGGICTSGQVGPDDIVGCGIAAQIQPPTNGGASCVPGLDAASGELCGALPTDWHCGTNASQEAVNVTKSDALNGGALCCSGLTP